MQGKKTLHLVMRGKNFEAILNGTQKTEQREIRPKNAHLYITYTQEKDGEFADPIEYEILRLYKGYEKNRPYFDVEVKKSTIVVFTDDDGEEIFYTENGVEYVQSIVEYDLGEISGKVNC